MYVVVSKWKVASKDAEEVEKRGRAVRDEFRNEPGIEIFESFKTEDGNVVAVLGYASKQDYDRIVNTPGGPFQTALQKHRLEDYAEWAWSERGETID